MMDYQIAARNRARKTFWDNARKAGLLALVGAGIGLEMLIVLTGPVLP